MEEMAKMRRIDRYTGDKFRSYEIDTTYRVAWGEEGVEARLASLCARAVDAVKDGYNILILTDRKMSESVSQSRCRLLSVRFTNT